MKEFVKIFLKVQASVIIGYMVVLGFIFTSPKMTIFISMLSIILVVGSMPLLFQVNIKSIDEN